MTPFCFVLMPFGRKPDPSGGPAIDFDAIYRLGIEPAVRAAGLKPIRADEERAGGIIHRQMFERLLLCEYAVADLTTANANVFYELGIRHAARPSTTIPIFADAHPLPFDVNLLRALPYTLGEGNRFDKSRGEALTEALSTRLRHLREEHPAGRVDSPLFELIADWRVPQIAHLKTDLFRARVQASEDLQATIAAARAETEPSKQREALDAVLAQLTSQRDTDNPTLFVDLLLSYRHISAFDRMVHLVDEHMPAYLQRQVMVQEQLALALNRVAGSDATSALRVRALKLLHDLHRRQGESSETLGIEGRIHKDLWKLTKATQPRRAKGHLREAINVYTRGFRADIRDAFPGINALTLLECLGTPDALASRDELLPVVRFAIENRLRGADADYFDYATLLELAVIASDEQGADENLSSALAAAGDERWKIETTANNLAMLRDARLERGEDVAWLSEIVSEMLAAAAA